MAASPYPGGGPPTPLFVPLELYAADREADRRYLEEALREERRLREHAHHETRDWLASIAKDVRALREAAEHRAGQTENQAEHAAQAAARANVISARWWAVKLAAIAATIGAAISTAFDRFTG